VDKKEFLLNSIIKAYICNCEPIGSTQLKNMYDIEFSTATIRGYFKKLGEDGFLVQEHISSGRTPSSEALKMYWAKNLSSLKLDNVDIDYIKSASQDLGISTIISLEQNEILTNLIQIQDKHLILEFESFSILIKNSDVVYRFLHELIGLELDYIKNIAKQVGAYELYEELSQHQLLNSDIFNISYLSSFFEGLDDDTIKYFLGAKIMSDLKDGIYFDDFIPDGHIGICKSCMVDSKSAKILTIGDLSKDYNYFYKMIN
jgi:heat-inducible transcriptional repressor